MNTEPRNLADLRTDYILASLSRDGVDKNPFTQMHTWLVEAQQAQIDDFNAMALATCDATSFPSNRIVLLKALDQQGLQFYTNYESQKARHLQANPNAAASIHWKELQRQIHVRGRVERLTTEESEAYFQSRPRDSQIGAWASKQSEPIPNRQWLEERERSFEEKFAGKPIPLPPFWGGFRLIPESFEFWQGRASRLHDRIFYQIDPNGKGWTISRLSP